MLRMLDSRGRLSLHKLLLLWQQILSHPDDWQYCAVAEWGLLILYLRISFGFVEGYATEGCAHLQALETRFLRGVLAGFEN